MAALSVEHLKVMAASRACFRILSSPLPYGRAPKGDGGQSSLLPHPYQSSPVGPLPYGRAPKGDGGLNSRACFLDAYWVGLWSSASGPYQSST